MKSAVLNTVARYKMAAAKYLLETFLLGPEIYACYQLGSLAVGSFQMSVTPIWYFANKWEICSNFVLSIIIIFWQCCTTFPFSPFIWLLTILYCPFKLFVWTVIAISLVYFFALCARVYGRILNGGYLTFRSILGSALTVGQSFVPLLRQYDFEFSFWPIEYQYLIKPEANRFLPPYQPSADRNFVLQKLLDVLCFAFAYTIFIPILYPGSMKLLQNYLFNDMVEGKRKLVKQKTGWRYRLLSSNTNTVDCMFFDRRNQGDNGNILVIICDGNCAFYERSFSTWTPLDAGYSVLCWNHPGFAGSSGVPWPDQECASVDVVVQFAVKLLAIPEENIVMYGYSIGGFSSTWAVMNYPKIKGVVLDATWEDIVPVFQSFVPEFMSSFVEQLFRTYANLHNWAQLKEYKGPVTIVRRTKDGLMCSEKVPKRNRANALVTNLLESRYPNLMDKETVSCLDVWLEHTAEGKQKARKEDDDKVCATNLKEYFTTNAEFPSKFGQEIDPQKKAIYAIFLANKHLVDFDAGHCDFLPSTLFKTPIHPWISSP